MEETNSDFILFIIFHFMILFIVEYKGIIRYVFFYARKKNLGFSLAKVKSHGGSTVTTTRIYFNSRKSTNVIVKKSCKSNESSFSHGGSTIKFIIYSTYKLKVIWGINQKFNNFENLFKFS